MFSDERIEELLAAEAVGSLDRSDRAEFERALRARPELRRRLEGLEEAANLMSFYPEPAAPDPAVKERVLGIAAKSPRTPESVSAAGWRNPFALLAGGVATASVGVAVAVAILLGGRVATWEDRARRATDKTAEQVAALDLLADGGRGVVRLSATEDAPGAAAYLVLTTDERTAVLVCSGLKRLPANQAYQLWLNKPNAKLSGGLVNSDYYGFAILVVRSPEDLTEFSTFGMTVEPAQGSPGPTGKKVLGGSFT